MMNCGNCTLGFEPESSDCLGKSSGDECVD
jgi:hypothetical protein